MCGYDNEVRIERLTNGYKLRMRDPKIVAQNKKRDSEPYDSKNRTPYQDPSREYVFMDIEAVLKFLKNNLNKALPAQSYSSSFDDAVEAAEED